MGLDEVSRRKLADFAATGKWKGLLHQSENLLNNHRLILDLNRITVDALRGLGDEYDAAALEVKAEVRALLTRLPTLLELRDRDGVPLADPGTRRWIASEVLPRSSTAAALTVSGDPGDDGEFWTALPARLQGKERGEALSEARAKIANATSGQLRFILTLHLAEAVGVAGASTLAEALLTGLAREADSLCLGRWEPALSARCLADLARAQHTNGSDYAQTLSALSVIDPVITAELLSELS